MLPHTANRFFGNYEAKVEEVYDAQSFIDEPELREKIPALSVGWLKITVPRFLGGARKNESGELISNKFFYARPESIFGGLDDVGSLCMPSKGANILVYFVAGDLSTHPVWKSSLWRGGSASPPKEASRDYRVLFKDEVGNIIGVSKKKSVTEKGETVEEFTIDIESPILVSIKAGKNVIIQAADEDVTVEATNVHVTASKGGDSEGGISSGDGDDGGDINIRAEGNINIIADGKVDINAEGDANVSSESEVNISAPRVSLN